MTLRCLLLVAAACLMTGASWIDPDATAREAARLYTSGNFASAATKYNEALVDDPDSTLLHYNLGASVYKQGKYEEAVTAYSQTPAADIGDVAYNVGNAKYRLGVETEASDPQRTLSLYAEALAAYRRAMGADPSDDDAKFNHEFVTRKIAELQKKLEEQKQKQEQEKQEQEKDQEEQQDQEQDQKQDEQQDQQQGQQQDQQQQPGDEQQQPPSEEQKPGEPKDSESEQNAGKRDEPKERTENQQAQQDEKAQQAEQPGNAAEQAAAAAGDQQADMSEHEAQALLDAARDQEARPEEIMRRMQRGDVLEPAEDW